MASDILSRYPDELKNTTSTQRAHPSDDETRSQCEICMQTACDKPHVSQTTTVSRKFSTDYTLLGPNALWTVSRRSRDTAVCRSTLFKVYCKSVSILVNDNVIPSIILHTISTHSALFCTTHRPNLRGVRIEITQAVVFRSVSCSALLETTVWASGAANKVTPSWTCLLSASTNGAHYTPACGPSKPQPGNRGRSMKRCRKGSAYAPVPRHMCRN